MATFVLIHGGGGSAWDWHLLVPELASRGHDVVVPELPIEDRSAGFAEFCETVVNASDLVVVGHSYGSFTAPLIADKLPVRLLVLLTPMIPEPGERPGDWWGNTGSRGTEGLSQEEQFYNGVPTEIVAEAAAHSGTRSARSGTSRGLWTTGRTCRRRPSSPARTSSSRPTSSAAWPPSGSGSARATSRCSSPRSPRCRGHSRRW